MTILLKIDSLKAWAKKLLKEFLQQEYYFYILANKSKTVFLTGVTLSLNSQRTQGQKIKEKTYDYPGSNEVCYNIAYWERYTDLRKALSRQQEVANWPPTKVDALIQNQENSIPAIDDTS